MVIDGHERLYMEAFATDPLGREDSGDQIVRRGRFVSRRGHERHNIRAAANKNKACSGSALPMCGIAVSLSRKPKDPATMVFSFV